MSVQYLIKPIPASDGPGSVKVHLPEAPKWMQGRTMYGGASAMIAYVAATRAFPHLPPLRAAQIGFVAPVGENLELRTQMIRQGRNVAQLRSDILCDGKVALTAFFLFGTGREPNARHRAAPVDDWTGGPEEAEVMPTDRGPSFIGNNFEIRRAQNQSGPLGPGDQPAVRRWLKLNEPSGLDPVAELILIGDTMPPGAMRAMQRQGPISSINWSFNVLNVEPTTRDGWWLAENASDHADDGYSSERLRLWNADGQQMLSGIQSVAVFG